MFSKRTGWKLEPNAFSVALEKYRATGKPLHDLTASNPTTVGLRYDEPALLNALATPAALTYEPEPKGLLSARKAVCRYYADLNCNVDPEDMILTVSTSEAYTYAFRLLCDPGDQVLVAVPSYPLFEFLADIQDVALAPYELVYDHGWQVDFHSLERAITARTRAILVVHPNNPTGSFIKPHEIEALNRLCGQHELAIIADEVFLDYALDAPSAPTFAANTSALTFTLSGVSKISGLPQMKMAWMITSGPPSLVTEAMARLEIIADTYLSPNSPSQHALPAMLDLRCSIQQQLQARIRENLAELDRQLAAQSLCSRLDVEGGWYATIRVPSLRSDEQFAVELLEHTGTLVHPGHFFNFPREGFVIVSLITPAPDFAEGIRRLLTFICS